MFENKDMPSLVLRIGLGIVFLYFGFTQAINPINWTSYVPEFLTNIISANSLVLVNGIVEISLGIMMLIGLYVRFASIILSLHLFFITFSIGFNPTGIRDLGLAIATLVIFLNGSDKYTLDYKFRKLE